MTAETASAVCAQNGENDVHTCEDRNVIWGTAGFVTEVLVWLPPVWWYDVSFD